VRNSLSFVGQVGNLRPIGNRPNLPVDRRYESAAACEESKKPTEFPPEPIANRPQVFNLPHKIYTMYMPPLISIVWPWINREAFEHRKSMVSAISSLVPSAPAGVIATTESRIWRVENWT